MKTKTKFILYIIIVAPGIIVHEFSHMIFCVLSGVRVFKVRYLQFKNPAGYVEHAQPRGFIRAFFISIGPLLFGSALSFALFWFTLYLIKNFQFSIFNFITIIFSIWFAFAIAINCFPSDGDARVLLSEAKRHVFQKFNPFALILFPFVWLIQLANYLKRWHFDWIYAIFLLILASYVVFFY